MERYEGFYARFDTPSKQVGSLMMGADDLVGNAYAVSLKNEDGRMVAWVANKFGDERGFFDEQTSQAIQLALARGQEVQALLAYVAYSDEPEPGIYWGEMAVFCFDPLMGDTIRPFIDRVGQRLGEGVRPKISLGTDGLRKLGEDPAWMPSENLPLLKMPKGSAVIKDHLSIGDKMVEQGRARNKGCYAISWIFIIALVALLAFLGLSIFGVLG